MKKQICDLSAVAREQLEEAYHQMSPEDLDDWMLVARVHVPETICLPDTLAERLSALADVLGEPEYQAMVIRWIEERLQQEARLALRVSKQLKPKAQAKPKAIAVLARRAPKKLPRAQTI